MEDISRLPAQEMHDLNSSAPQMDTQPETNAEAPQERPDRNPSSPRMAQPGTVPKPPQEHPDTHTSFKNLHSSQIRCKSCARVLATASQEGLDPAPVTEGCAICQHFQTLYDVMQAADEHYATYRDRRDTYAPKLVAFGKLRKAKLEFNNWLLDVEAAARDTIEPELDSTTVHASRNARGTKRERSLSLTSEGQSSSSPSNIPEAARKYKRLKFSNSVEFRDEYRPSPNFSRSDDAYSRGRYAAPEGEEHLDTSGLALTHLKFSGMKRVGAKWVDVWEEVNDPERSKKKGKKKREDEEVAETEDAASWETIETQSSDPRSLRLARRQNGTASRKHIAVRSKNGGAHINSIKSASQMGDKGRQPIGTPSGFVDGPRDADTQSTTDSEQRTREVPEDIAQDLSVKEVGEESLSEGTANVATSAAIEDTSSPESTPAASISHSHGETTEQQPSTATQASCTKPDEASANELDTTDTTAPAETRSPNGKAQEHDSTSDMQHIVNARHQDLDASLNGQDAIADEVPVGAPPGEVKSDVVEATHADTSMSTHDISTIDRQTLNNSTHPSSEQKAP